MKEVSLNTKLFIVVFICAAVLRMWGVFDQYNLIGDEIIDIPSAKAYFENGVGNWRYPYLKSIIYVFDIKAFGDNPVGWRIDNIVFGILSILLVYLITQQIYKKHTISLVAASLLAFDPFHIHFSRAGTMEIPVLFFFLMFLYLMLEQSVNHRNTLLWAGIALGLTIATKAYFIFAIPFIGGYGLYCAVKKANERKMSVCLEFFVMLVLLPLSIYLMVHFLWFARGHTLGEFLLLKSDSISTHNVYTFVNADILQQGGKPWEWFVKPFSFGHQLSQDGQYGRFALQINNPLFRIMVLPAALFVSWCAVTGRNFRHLLAPLLFISCYLLFFISKRPFNSYSALVLLPFAYMMVAQAVSLLSRRYHCELEITTAFMFVIVAWGCYLFPVSTGFQVPIELYRSLIEFSAITRVF
jgi:dolichyl-phosphate-mannose--protein O-mannosyl transferase